MQRHRSVAHSTIPRVDRQHFILVAYAVVIATGLPILGYRKRAMRRLAAKLRFEYLGKTLPDSFPLPEDPFRGRRLVWNVISGYRHGHRIVAFDSIIEGGRGRYCSFIAVQMTDNPFEMKSKQWKLLQANGWTALYWIGPWNSFITWTMSTKFIEQVVMFLNAHLSETSSVESGMPQLKAIEGS